MCSDPPEDFELIPGARPQIRRGNRVGVERAAWGNHDRSSRRLFDRIATSRSTSPGDPLTSVPRLSTPQQIAGPSQGVLRQSPARRYDRPSSSREPDTAQSGRNPAAYRRRAARSAPRPPPPRECEVVGTNQPIIDPGSVPPYRPSRRGPKDRCRSPRPPGSWGKVAQGLRDGIQGLGQDFRRTARNRESFASRNRRPFPAWAGRGRRCPRPSSAAACSTN